VAALFSALSDAAHAPNWMPVYPANSVHGSAKRTAPVGWVCPNGHRHTARECREATK